jgi:hypothetical protein
LFQKINGKKEKSELWSINTRVREVDLSFESSWLDLTLLSDGSMESFPNNTVAQFKTLLPHPLNLTDWDWEVALTEMMYSVDLKNISTHEAYFDVFVPDTQSREVTDPNLYGWNRFIKEKLGTVPLHDCSSLIPWEQTPWAHYVAKGGSILRVNLYRIRFRAGAYTQPWP